MRKWKLIVLTAALSMLVGMQAFAAEVPEGSSDQVNAEEQVPENTQEGSSQPVQGETDFTTNLPKLDYYPEGISRGILNGVIVCEDNTEVTSTPQNRLMFHSPVSSKTVSQEEAKKLFGTSNDCESVKMDIKVGYGSPIEEINNKTVKEVRLTSALIVDTYGEPGRWISKLTGGTLRTLQSGVLKAFYFPSEGASYTECTNIRLDDGYVFFDDLNGITIPIEGASIVLVWSSSADSPSQSSGTPAPSHDSGTPEVYSHGASVGEIGVKKSGAGVQAHVRKANGEETSVIVHPYLNPGTKTLTQAQAQRMLGTSFACSIYSFDLSIVNAEEDYGPVTLLDGSVPVTFFVPGVTPESKVALRHWINGGSTYEDLPVEVGNGTVKATFTSFSPVVIVVEQPGVAAAAAANANGPVSPKTGETSGIYMAEVLALLSLAGLFYCRKRRQG
ncbi:MAG: LPXTG cell wall anchor domain-containing protein [Lachnospiraceae bacterium]|jgi:LPXTG-motif cell wall-anchored protein|nr:LPXTG cell wall anchor domain-containing protein [Lachnospiraceae bacterium]